MRVINASALKRLNFPFRLLHRFAVVKSYKQKDKCKKALRKK